MVTITKQNGHISYGIKEFLCDSISDIQDLPIDCKSGSTAFIIETSQVYMLNNAHEWKEV